MLKKYTKMTRIERQFQDACRRVCLPVSQAEIYNDLLNANERQIVEDGTREDIERRKLHKKTKRLPENFKRSDFDVLCGNGASNIARIADHRSVAPERLALDFALTLGFLAGEAQHRRLVKQFCGEDLSILGASIEFRDNMLSVNGVLDGQFRPAKNSRGDHIVRSFEETGWRDQRIDFTGSFKNRRALRDCIANLNKKTRRLKFKLGGEQWVTWELVETERPDS